MTQENNYKYYLSDGFETSVEIEKERYEALCKHNHELTPENCTIAD